MSVAEADCLRAAWSKIDAPEKWCKGQYRKVNPGVIQYCADGATFEIPIGPHWRAARETLKSVLPAEFNRDISLANDDPATTHADVRRWFAEAIARAEAEE